ncbi:hypothetical protein [Nostoc flagelliforme]|uniref:hypothetical protein n=1 Tax=Nostoc flagelliforme TaxID=1306274 RepID=UPI001688FD08|nr:hypothetical protein [Nostoc flagelliforme]
MNHNYAVAVVVLLLVLVELKSAVETPTALLDWTDTKKHNPPQIQQVYRFL